MTNDAILEARKDWALAKLAAVVNAGRRARWLPGDPVEGPSEDAARAALSDEAGSAMAVLEERFELGREEIDLLWLLACIEIDPALSRAAQFLMPSGMTELSAQIVGVMFGGAVRALDALAALGLIEACTDPGLPWPRRPVRVDDRVLDLVRGRLALSRDLDGVATLDAVTAGVVPGGARVSGRVLLVATGPEGSGRARALRARAEGPDRAVLVVDARRIPADRDQRRRFLRAVARESTLHGAWPLFRDADDLGADVQAFEREILEALDVPVMVTVRAPCRWATSRYVVAVDVPMLEEGERRALWADALATAPRAVIDHCVARYRLTPGAILDVARVATSASGGAVTSEGVQRAVRVRLEHALGGLARRVDIRQRWDDLVLPVDQLDLLIELVARAKHRGRVLDDWGFADKIGRGLGITALLSGPPGTGKTMIAGLVARELGLDLYAVDLSRVVSKYIGETEKQLAALFDAAESGHALLLFDEADALFARRTEVRSSHDRNANLEVNYLLQRLEAIEGIALLTTNHEQSIDPAFLRRLALHVRVPAPDETQRAALWRALLPERAPRAADLDVEGLARTFAMTGGYIKNAVVRAAFLAADAGCPIGAHHLWRAARAEYEGLGRVGHS